MIFLFSPVYPTAPGAAVLGGAEAGFPRPPAGFAIIRDSFTTSPISLLVLMILQTQVGIMTNLSIYELLQAPKDPD